MNKLSLLIASAALSSGLLAETDFAGYVNPLIGTEFNGHTTAAAAYPFGLVQAGPDTGRGTWDYCSGYRGADQQVWGFSQTHLSGTGCPDLGDLRLQPGGTNRAWNFRKETEKAVPGSYSVTLDGIDVGVDVAVTRRAAIYRFTYNGEGPAELLIDTQWMLADKGQFATCVHASDIAFDEKAGTVSGWRETHGWAVRKLGYRIETDRPWTWRKLPAEDERERGGRYVLTFAGLKRGETVSVKLGLSASGDPAAAKRNLDAEIPGWDFARVRDDARAAWNRLLGRMRAKGDADQLVSFYTSVYHLFFQPNDISDVGDGAYFSTLSTWDTFRAAHPLYTLVAPESVPGFVDSMLRDGRKHGYVSIWALWGFDNQCMIGTHSIPVIVDAILKGLWKGDAEEAYRLVKRSVTENFDRYKGNFEMLDRYGYYPFDLIRGESVSRTLECAYDDWCVARLAERLGHTADAERFDRRAANWRNVFDRSVGLVRGKDAKGNWREPFNPFALGHGANLANDFTEGNSYQYTWHVMQDPVGLVQAIGGKDAFAEKLDLLFHLPDRVEGAGWVGDVSGLIGQYAHGNEPSHHVVYFFQFADRPDRTAELVRQVFDQFYLPKPDGLCGNDDCGQMSAWYLFSAMGFYPFNPCGGDYVIGAPQFAEIAMDVGGGRTLRMTAKGLSKANKYVKSVSFDGKPVEGFVLRHAQLAKGGELVFEMTDRPAER